jgi:hypothetical protein
MSNATVITSKGVSSIPATIRRQAGIGPKTVLNWALHPDGVIVVRKQVFSPEQVRKHIRAHSGSWVAAT